MENKLDSNYILKQLQVLRVKLSLTQDVVANHLGISTKHLSEIERCISNPSFELLLELINFYNEKNGSLIDLNTFFYK